MVRALYLIVIAAGCGNHQPPGPSPVGASRDAAVDAPGLDQDLPKLALRGVTLFEDVAKAFAAAGDNCAAATTKLGELTTTYADVIAAQKKVLHEGRAMQLKLALRPYDERLEPAAKAIVQSKTMQACSENEAFAKAFDLVASPP